MPNLSYLFSILLLTFCCLHSAYATQIVGEVKYVRGMLLASTLNKPSRVLAQSSDLFLGDTLITGKKGFSVIQLNDRTTVSLRPNTQFKLEKLNFNLANKNALLTLIRGGFRMVTGLISKNRNASTSFRVKTPVATIGIRGTKFDARICNNDCQSENSNLSKKKQQSSSVIGRIALLKGRAFASQPNKKARPLSVGSAIYVKDKIKSQQNSYSVIAFNDNSRITLIADSTMKIKHHKYAPKTSKQNNALIELIRGGLRVVTGAIGKLNRSEYLVTTHTATFGIRGTGFDLFCDGDCKKTLPIKPPQSKECKYFDTHGVLDIFRKNAPDADKSLLVKVWDGSIDFKYLGCTFELHQDETAVLDGKSSTAFRVINRPAIKEELEKAPRPDKVKIPATFFPESPQTSTEPAPGLYVNVRDGDIQLTGQDNSSVDLGESESGYVTLQGAASRLSLVPAFMTYDSIPVPSEFSSESSSLINLIGASQATDKTFQCYIR